VSDGDSVPIDRNIQIETARSFYESARTELLARIEHRDNVLLLYLAAVGAIFGAFAACADRPAAVEIFLVIPFLTLGTSFLVSQHHEIIGQIAWYLTCELDIFLRQSPTDVTQIDLSDGLNFYYDQALDMRNKGQFFILLSPAVIGMFFSYDGMIKDFFSGRWRHPLIWILGLGALIWSFILILKANGRRKDVKNKIKVKYDEIKSKK
jgi:hypothetical protein